VKIIFLGLSLEIWYRGIDSYLEDFREKHNNADALVALKIGK
jgi:hypothetical protein